MIEKQEKKTEAISVISDLVPLPSFLSLLFYLSLLSLPLPLSLSSLPLPLSLLLHRNLRERSALRPPRRVLSSSPPSRETQGNQIRLQQVPLEKVNNPQITKTCYK